MSLRFVQTSVRWIAALSLVLFSFGGPVVAQVDSLWGSVYQTPQIEAAPLRSASPNLSASGSVVSASSLDPYRSLEQFVAPADWRTSIGITVQTPAKPHVELSRGGYLFWGTVGLFVHSYCDSRTDEFSPVTDHLPEYQTFDDARCDQCAQIGKRALGAVIGGLFAGGS